MTNTTDFSARRKPLVPEDLRRNGRLAAQPFIRAAVATALAHLERSYPSEVVKRRWPQDRDTALIVKASVDPASIAGSNWADTLAGTVVANFIASMGPSSAGAALLSRGLQLQYDGAAAIVMPHIKAATGNTAFVGEGAPIGVRQLVAGSSATLAPRKFASIIAFMREIFEHSTPNIELLVGTVLRESVGLDLDAALLDANAASASRPAGLRNGISAETESANADLYEAMIEDLDAIVTGVADIAGNNEIVVIAAPSRARRLRLRMQGRDWGFTLLSSSALAADELIAVATNGLISALDPAARFDVSTQVALHMEDTSPQPISLASTVGDIAYPVRSLWQTDSLGLRLIMEVSWGLRDPGALAWIEDVIW
jgi:hypothetical protein